MQDLLLSHLRSFVGFRTTRDQRIQQQECLDWIQAAFFHGTRLPVHRGSVGSAPYVYLEHPEPQLLLFAHIDVVPGHEHQFSLEQADDRLYGRGVKDMKGPTLVMLMAYESLLEEGVIPPVSILFTADEETTADTIPSLMAQGLFTHVPAAFTPDTGSHARIITEQKAGMWLELTVHGTGCHAAAPWKGQNPVQRLAAAICALDQAFPAGTEEDWRMTVSPSFVRGSDAFNVVPARAVCGLDVRYPAGIFSHPDQARDAIAAVLPSGADLRIVHTVLPLQTDAAHPLIQLLRSVSADVLGYAPEIGREHGASDARFFCALGIPAFLYGPDGGDLHGDREWVSLSSLLQQYEILRRFLGALPHVGP